MVGNFYFRKIIWIIIDGQKFLMAELRWTVSSDMKIIDWT